MKGALERYASCLADRDGDNAGACKSKGASIARMKLCEGWCVLSPVMPRAKRSLAPTTCAAARRREPSIEGCGLCTLFI